MCTSGSISPNPNRDSWQNSPKFVQWEKKTYPVSIKYESSNWHFGNNCSRAHRLLTNVSRTGNVSRECNKSTHFIYIKYRYFKSCLKMILIEEYSFCENMPHQIYTVTIEVTKMYILNHEDWHYSLYVSILNIKLTPYKNALFRFFICHSEMCDPLF